VEIGKKDVQEEQSMDSKRLSRRDFLKFGSVLGISGLAGLTIIGCSPETDVVTGTQEPGTKPTQGKTTASIRTIGLGVSVQDRFLREFEEQYGHKIEGTAGGYPEFFTKFLAGSYKNYHVNEPNAAHFEPFYDAGVIQTLKTSEVKKWDTLRPLFKDPDAPGHDPTGSGWPTKPLYTPASWESGTFDMVYAVPHYMGMDSIGFRRDLLGYDIDSYGALYDPEFKGKTAIWNEPVISMGNIANYLTKSGQLSPKNRIAQLEPDEVDQCVEFLIERKKDGQFRAIWDDYGQAVNLLGSGEVLVIDAWSPIVMDVRKQDKDAVYARVKEGYPGWFHGIVISSIVEPGSPEYLAALDYIDYWLSGSPGAAIAAQGYYSPSTTAEEVLKGMHSFSEDMNDYEAWYLGEIGWPVGGMEDRLGNIGWWEEWPENADYYIKRWKDFLSA
jgi:putative spermidine/putrescine transport system substrate-binding protein